MDFVDIWADEIRCDLCGQSTPRLEPPADIELCDRCYGAQQQHAADLRRIIDDAIACIVAGWDGPVH